MSNANPQVATRSAGQANVLTLTRRRLSNERSPHASIHRDFQRAVVLQFDRAQNDEVALRRVAPWMQQEIDPVEVWRRCLFMSRFAKHADAAVGLPTVGNIDWKIDRGSVIKGKIATQAGNLIVTMNRWDAYFKGHRDALLQVGIARANWLINGPRGTPANRFEANVFDARREVTIHRNRDRYSLSMSLTDEEGAQVAEERFEQVAMAREAVGNAVKQLPSARSDYQRKISEYVGYTVDLLERYVCMSEGGFSLDDRSRAAILTQLDGLRQVARQVTATFDREERVSNIESIAQKHAPKSQGVPDSTT